MTVRELLNDAISPVWITTKEDPNQDGPEIIVNANSDYEEKDFLSEQILDSEVHLIKSTGNALYVSLMWQEWE
jgi:hypothetical protein